MNKVINMYGYCGKLLDIDLSSNKVRVIELDEEVLRKFIGGRGLAAWILWKELGNRWQEIDPLGPENILTVLTGPLTGYYPGMKICISGKSPQSNGIVGSAISTSLGIEIKAAGYDGILIRGRASSPIYLFIFNDRVEFRDAGKLWGKRGRETYTLLMNEIFKEINRNASRKGYLREPGILYIGPAGENRVRIASIMSEITHAAGYGGYGAVMGSKNLKAIVVKGTGPLPSVANMDKVRALFNKVLNTLLRQRKTLREWGTPQELRDTAYTMSSQPVKNWRSEWYDSSEMSVYSIESRYRIKRFRADDICPLACMKVTCIKKGPYKGSISDSPDYELLAYLGPNLGIFNLEHVIYLISLIDDYGVCGINAGNLLGFIAELFSDNILTKNDFNGLEVKWGDVEGFAELIKVIALRKGLGDLFAEGIYRAILKLSQIRKIDVNKLLEKAIQCKGIAIGAHGVRSKRDYPQIISYALSVQGGDHTSIATYPPQQFRGFGEGEYFAIFLDSAVVCMFTYVHEYGLEFLNAVTGWNIDENTWVSEIAPRILSIQRATLLIGGPDIYWDPRVHDENPSRFYEPLPEGPYKGQRVEKEEFIEMRRKYYEAVGWDEHGIPRSDVLKKLGLEDVDKALEPIRKRYY